MRVRHATPRIGSNRLVADEFRTPIGARGPAFRRNRRPHAAPRRPMAATGPPPFARFQDGSDRWRTARRVFQCGRHASGERGILGRCALPWRSHVVRVAIEDPDRLPISPAARRDMAPRSTDDLRSATRPSCHRGGIVAGDSACTKGDFSSLRTDIDPLRRFNTMRPFPGQNPQITTQVPSRRWASHER